MEKGYKDQALGRSRGRLATKIHMVCDARGPPMSFALTGPQAIPLLEGIETVALIADIGY